MGAQPSRSSARDRPELADILRAQWHRLGPLAPVQRRVVDAILACRTAALGGHVDRCTSCGHLEISYNSCRNRHCPKCLGLEQARWVEKRAQDLLPVPYHHVVFTVPAELRPIFLADRENAFAALFRASASTLKDVAERPANLGARIGFLSVLHTWTQRLDFHPHVHCIVAGGGLSLDQTTWVSARPGFFLSVRKLAVVFRAKLLQELERRADRGELDADPATVHPRLRKAARKAWVVYSKPPFGGPEHVLRYLGRYTHRIAISNQRILALDGDRVTFSWRDRADRDQKKTATLDAVLFLRRFLLHVLPRGFVRIRSYGFLANGLKRKRLALCRELLDAPAPADPDGDTPEPWEDLLERLTGEDPHRCPECGAGRLEWFETFARGAHPRAVARPP